MTVFHNLLALSSLSVFLCTLNAVPVTALSPGYTSHAVRHHEIARSVTKIKRDRNRKRCKARSGPQPALPGTTDSSIASGGNGDDNGGTPPPYSGGKKGLAWPTGQDNELEKWTHGRLSWYYNWHYRQPDNTHGLEFIPMLWGRDTVDQFRDYTNSPAFTANTVLAFNEPQEPGQSNMNPWEAADIWRRVLSPLKARGIRIGSPAPSSNPNGKTWIQTFIQVCPDCHFDFVALHWYDVRADDFIAYVNDFHNTFQKPIWVTEWACQNFNGGPQCTPDETWAFVQKTVDFLENAPFVERYGYFGAMRDMSGVDDSNRLMDWNGYPNSLGYTYLG